MNEMVVAKYFQLLRSANGYTKEGKTLLRSKVVVTREYAEGINADFRNNGKWYEIDEKATSEYHGVKSEPKSDEEKPKRVRRTKEEIEADKKK